MNNNNKGEINMSKFRILDTLTRNGRTAYLIGGDGLSPVNDKDPMAILYPAENGLVPWAWSGEDRLARIFSENRNEQELGRNRFDLTEQAYNWLESHLAANSEPKTVTVECDVIDIRSVVGYNAVLRHFTCQNSVAAKRPTKF